MPTLYSAFGAVRRNADYRDRDTAQNCSYRLLRSAILMGHLLPLLKFYLLIVVSLISSENHICTLPCIEKRNSIASLVQPSKGETIRYPYGKIRAASS